MTDTTIGYYNRRYEQSQSVFNQFPKTKRIVGGVLSTVNIDIDNKDDRRKAMIIGGTTLVAGLSALMFSKGIQSFAKKGLNALKEHFEQKVETLSSEGSEKRISFYESSIRRINSFLQKSESINNFNSVKDILFMKLMYKTSPTRKIHKGISNFFERLSLNTVKSSYKQTQKSFDNMYKAFDKLDEYILKTSGDELVTHNGVTKTKREFVQQAKDYRESVKMVVGSFIADGTQQARYQYIKGATSELYSKFWDESFKGFWTKDNKFKRKQMWQTFIAAEQVKGNKTNLAENVAFARNMLSYTDKEKVSFLSGYVSNLNSLIPATDAEGIDIIRKVEWLAKDPAILKDNKEALLKELDRLEKHPLPKGLNPEMAEANQKDKDTNIRLIRNMVNDSATGELQDMIDIYYKLAPFELAKSGAKKSAETAVKSFDKSVNLEIGEFFDKERDLELGSAPTDILTILTSCGMITYGLGRAKNKDERKSVMLKSGIPIVGAVATSLISATKLVSGGKSIALGIISGIALNRMGVVADNFRKGFKPQTKKSEKVKA